MTINFKNNIIYLLGDTHSLKTTLYKMKTFGGKEADFVFLGDGGEGFASQAYDEFVFDLINKALVEKDSRLFCIRGNHSNPEVWERGYGYSNLFLVPDYSEAVFPNGKTALLVGGGLSIDRQFRQKGKDYWAEEITPYQKLNKTFDILLSHDAPDYFNYSTLSLKTSPWAPLLITDPSLYEDALAQRETINQIVEDIKPNFIYSGHFHRSIKEELMGIKYQGLNIEEIITLNSIL